MLESQNDKNFKNTDPQSQEINPDWKKYNKRIHNLHDDTTINNQPTIKKRVRTKNSKLTIISAKKRAGDSGIGLYFPYVGFTVWCLQKFGPKLFLKHISHFKYLNVHAAKKMLRELVKL